MPENHPLFSFICEGRGSVLSFLHFFKESPCFAGSLGACECTYSGEEQKQLYRILDYPENFI